MKRITSRVYICIGTIILVKYFDILKKSLTQQKKKDSKLKFLK